MKIPTTLSLSHTNTQTYKPKVCLKRLSAYVLYLYSVHSREFVSFHPSVCYFIQNNWRISAKYGNLGIHKTIYKFAQVILMHFLINDAAAPLADQFVPGPLGLYLIRYFAFRRLTGSYIGIFQMFRVTLRSPSSRWSWWLQCSPTSKRWSRFNIRRD
jgi:hypothetical protein